jgi:hypothetical protein
MIVHNVLLSIEFLRYSHLTYTSADDVPRLAAWWYSLLRPLPI